MAYLSDKGYNYDALISYAHIDNELEGWVSEFHKRLNIKIRMISGQKSIELWRDTEITGNEYFNQVISNRLDMCGLFIACNSPSYKTSDYCEKEIMYFHRTIQKPNDTFGLRINNESRIFNILLYKTPNEQWLSPLAGRTGYPFYDKQLPKPLSPASGEYDDAITILANDVWNLLSEMKNKNTKRETIFFAKCPASLGFYQEQLQRNLGKRTLLQPNPDEDLPVFETLHNKKVGDILNNACSSIHLFDEGEEDEGGGEKFKDTNNYYYISQAEVALQTNIPQLIWFPKNLNIERINNPFKKAFLENLTRITKKELEIIPGSRPDICRVIESWVDKFINKQPPGENTDYWLIDADADDAQNLDEITDDLKRMRKEILNHQSSDDLLADLVKVNHYILIINKYPYSSVERLKTIVKDIPQMPPGSKLGIYIAPHSKPLNEDQIKSIKQYQESGFKVFDARGYNIDNHINSMTDFINELS